MFCIGNPTPIFETELELIKKHQLQGDTVRVLQCTGNLANCLWNPEHLKSGCEMCRSRFKNGWSLLNTYERVELKHFPKNKPSFSDFTTEFKTVDELKEYHYDGAKIGMGVASALISMYRDHSFDTRKYRKMVSITLQSAIQVYNTLKFEFKEYKPDIVYIFNSRITTQLPAVLLCEKMGIKYFTYEIATPWNCYTLRRNARIDNIEVVHQEIDILWGNGGYEREQTARVWFEYNRNRVTVGMKVGYITKEQEKGKLPESFDINKKNIAIFTSTLDEYVAVEGWENPLYQLFEAEGLYKILESFESNEKYIFYIRVHPRLMQASINCTQLKEFRVVSSNFPKAHFIWSDSLVDSYALLDACEKIITFGSTIGIEAAYWGKPSILAGRAFYENFDCVYVPKTHEELVELIKRDLAPLPAYSAMKYGFHAMSNGTPFKYFKQTGASTGLFNGVEIIPDPLPLSLKILLYLKKPTLILIKIQGWIQRLKEGIGTQKI